jgi:hypothetical protein
MKLERKKGKEEGREGRKKGGKKKDSCIVQSK